MDLSNTVKKMIIVMAVTGVVFAVAGVIVSLNLTNLITPIPFVIGVALGTIFNGIKVVWLEHTVNKIVNMDDPKAGANYLRMQNLLRFWATAGILLIGAYVPFVDLFGAIFGVLTFFVGKYSLAFITK